MSEQKDCLPGYYCEKGSTTGTPCPAGTYTAQPKGSFINPNFMILVP